MRQPIARVPPSSCVLIFPRIPFPDTREAFDALSALGSALVGAHLLRELPRPGLAAYHGKGDHAVEAVRYAPEEQDAALRAGAANRLGPFASAAIRCSTNT